MFTQSINPVKEINNRPWRSSVMDYICRGLILMVLIFKPSDGVCDPDWTEAPASGGCYRYFSTPKHWLAANSACISVGGHLVIYNAEGDVALLTGISTRAWVGVSRKDDGTWVWLSGSSVSWIPWAMGQPGIAVDLNCVQQDDTGHWYAADCGEQIGYICSDGIVDINTEVARQASAWLREDDIKPCPYVDPWDMGADNEPVLNPRSGFCYGTLISSASWSQASGPMFCNFDPYNTMMDVMDELGNDVLYAEIAIKTSYNTAWIGQNCMDLDEEYRFSDRLTPATFINMHPTVVHDSDNRCLYMSVLYGGRWKETECDTNKNVWCKLHPIPDVCSTDADCVQGTCRIGVCGCKRYWLYDNDYHCTVCKADKSCQNSGTCTGGVCSCPLPNYPYNPISLDCVGAPTTPGQTTEQITSQVLTTTEATEPTTQNVNYVISRNEHKRTGLFYMEGRDMKVDSSTVPLKETLETTPIHCAHSCLNEDGCCSFHYKTGDTREPRECKLFEQLFTSTDLVSQSTYQYFRTQDP